MLHRGVAELINFNSFQLVTVDGKAEGNGRLKTDRKAERERGGMTHSRINVYGPQTGVCTSSLQEGHLLYVESSLYKISQQEDKKNT